MGTESHGRLHLWSKWTRIAVRSTKKTKKKLDARNAVENEDSFYLPYPMTLRFHAPLIFFRASDLHIWLIFFSCGQMLVADVQVVMPTPLTMVRLRWPSYKKRCPMLGNIVALPIDCLK